MGRRNAADVRTLAGTPAWNRIRFIAKRVWVGVHVICSGISNDLSHFPSTSEFGLARYVLDWRDSRTPGVMDSIRRFGKSGLARKTKTSQRAKRERSNLLDADCKTRPDSCNDPYLTCSYRLHVFLSFHHVLVCDIFTPIQFSAI